MSAQKQLLPLSFFLSAILFLVIVVSASSSSPTIKETLGIAPQDETYFNSAVIKCRDGSKKFTKEQLNDDFCDCPDGTDEPGTSACPEGRFYCRNAGHIPLTLFSSRVNDGICDCCDGSDEYDGKLKCQNTCWEAGKAARDKLKNKIATYQDGVAIRMKEVEQAKQTIAKDEAELVKLKSEEKILKGLVHQLKDRKEQIEKAEEQERREKEKEQKRKEPEEKAHEHEQQSSIDIADENLQHGEEKLSESPNVVAKEIDDSIGETQADSGAGNEAAPTHAEDEGGVDTSVGDENVHDTTSEGPSDHSEQEEKEGSQLSKEELGRLVASRWTGEKSEEQPDEIDDRENEAEQHETNPEDDYDGYSSESDEDNRKYGDDETHDKDDAYDDVDEDPLASYSPDEDKTDFSDVAAASSSSWLDKIQETVKTILQAVNLFKTPVDKSEAAQVRKEYDESSSKLSKLQSRISTLTKKLGNDYGPEKEFYSFYDHCFENKENKYVYKVCPFKEASQVEGYSTTHLGRWEKFEDSYRVMLFLHGDKCWNGPDRSLKVKLRCGLKNELADVDEPSRCEYVALLSTPAVCSEERLKELQHKLDLMNKDLPQSHDEL